MRLLTTSLAVPLAIALTASAIAAQTSLCSAALKLSGNGEHVVVPNHRDLQNASAVTYEAWVYPTRVRGRPISKGDGQNSTSNRSFDMTYTATNYFAAEFFLKTSSGRAYVPMVAPTTTPLNKWTHVAATFDSAKREAILYVDGKQVVKKTTPAGGTLYQSTKPLVIGGTPPYSIWFQGEINQVRVWNVALPAALVAAYRFVESHSLPGVKAAWPFDGHLFDLAGGHDGTEKGGTVGFVGGCATWTNYHPGTAGPHGIPSLTVDKKPVIGTTINVITDNTSKASATGIFVLGLKPLDVPFLGGKLLAEPLFVLSLPIGASGAQWPFTIPNDMTLVGTPVFTQLGVFYGSNPQPGLSRGLQFMIGT